MLRCRGELFVGAAEVWCVANGMSLRSRGQRLEVSSLGLLIGLHHLQI